MSTIHCPNCGVLAGVSSGWRKSEPRSDGVVIVAMGNIVSHYEEGAASVDPFVAEICWKKNDSGFEGWHYASSGMAVAMMHDDEVHVNWWIDVPQDIPYTPPAECACPAASCYCYPAAKSADGPPPLFIRHLHEDDGDTIPARPCDFKIEGSSTEVVEACKRDFASYPKWDYYIVCEKKWLSWRVWQTEIGKAVES